MDILQFLKDIFHKGKLEQQKRHIKHYNKSIQEISKFVKDHKAEEIIRMACEKSNMLPYYNDILNIAKPSTLLLTEEDNLVEKEIGSSRFGGCPDVPQDFNWPKVDNTPLTFILQINCEELPEYAFEIFPSKGILSFFFCFDNQLTATSPSKDKYGKVFHFDNNLTKKSPPKHPNIYKIPACRITLIDFPSFPYYYDTYSKDLWNFKFLNNEENLADRYMNFCDKLEELAGLNQREYHQLLGYPRSIQGTNIEFIISQAKQHSTKKFSALSEDEIQNIYEQKLILQIQEIEDINFFLIDCGKIYFMGNKGKKVIESEIWTTLDFG